MDFCPECGAYWLGCGHWDGPPMPLEQTHYVDLSGVQYGETVHGYDVTVGTDSEGVTIATALNEASLG